MSDDLLPCPFCGGEAEVHEEQIHMEGSKYRTRCTVCYVQTDYYDGPATPQLVSDWNRRVWIDPEAYQAVKDQRNDLHYRLGALTEETMRTRAEMEQNNAQLRAILAQMEGGE